MYTSIFLMAFSLLHLANAGRTHESICTFKYFNATFDDIQLYQPSPNPYNYANWTGFVPYPASDFNLTASSPPNVAWSPGHGAWLTYHNLPGGTFGTASPDPNGNDDLVLSSFSFACVVDHPEGTWTPIACEVILIREGAILGEPVAYIGPFEYDLNTDDGEQFAMTKIDFGANVIDFSRLYVDVVNSSLSGVSIVWDDFELAGDVEGGC